MRSLLTGKCEVDLPLNAAQLSADKMEVNSTPLRGLCVLSPRIFSDARGSFCELWRADEVPSLFGGALRFLQDNVSWSLRNTLRGLHYQVAPFEQGKLICVLHGAIFDVAVDIRESSPTFGHHFSIELSSQNKQMLWMPEGFAHGFLVLSASAAVMYKTTNFYNPGCERSIRWNDSDLSISWPLAPDSLPLLSDKDRAAPLFTEIEPSETQASKISSPATTAN
jgi:dTDP-4-dehydrorhamnose 3,5-epimerase